jgi:hypothetical protein
VHVSSRRAPLFAQADEDDDIAQLEAKLALAKQKAAERAGQKVVEGRQITPLSADDQERVATIAETAGLTAEEVKQPVRPRDINDIMNAPLNSQQVAALEAEMNPDNYSPFADFANNPNPTGKLGDISKKIVGLTAVLGILAWFFLQGQPDPDAAPLADLPFFNDVSADEAAKIKAVRENYKAVGSPDQWLYVDIAQRPPAEDGTSAWEMAVRNGEVMDPKMQAQIAAEGIDN